MAKERREKELPKGKPKGRVERSSSTRSQRNIPHSHARSPSIQPIDCEQRYRALFDRSLQYICIHDFEGNILDINEVALKLLGYDREDIPHLNIASFLSKDQLPKASAALQELKDTGMTNQLNEWRLRCKDGSFVDMLLTGALIYREGKPHAILGVGINITEHKRAEESLRLSEQNFRNSIEKSPLGIRIVTADGNTLYVNKALLDICGYGSLEELKAVPRNQLYTAESYAEHRKRVNKRKRREYVPSNYEISIVRKDGQVRRLSVSRGEVLWDGEKQSQVVYQDITEHKQVEEALRESEERYRALFDRSLDCVFIHDFEGNFLDANEAALKLVGYDREDIPHLNFASLLSQDQLAMALATLQELKDTGTQKQVNEYRLRCKDGSFVDVEVIGAVIYHEGKPYAIQGVGRDITAHKQAEEILRRSEEKYRTILDEMGDGYFETDLAGNLTFVNDAMIRILGYSKEEMIGMNFRALRPEKEAKAVFKAYNRMYRTGEPLRNLFTEITCKDGRQIFAETSAFPIRNDRGEIIGFRGIRRDITERKQAKEALEKSEERYRQLAENAGEAILVVQDNVIKFANPKGAELSGYSIEELASRPFVKFIHPNDIDMVADRYARRLKGGSVPQIYDFRIIRKDGDIRWSELNAVPISWEDQPAVLCFMSDITERKKAEEALRQSEENYKTLFNSSVIGMYVLDVETMKVMMGNRAAAEMAGFSSVGEGIGINPFDFVIPEARDQVLEMATKEFEQDLRRTHELPVITKDGGTGWISITSTRIMHEGKLAALVSFTDITERKRMEEALRQSEERYRTMLEEMEEGYYEADLAGTFTFVNDAMSHILGYSRDELIGMNYKIYTPKEDVKAIFKAYNRVYRTGEPLRWYPMAEFRKDGTLILAEDSVFPMRNDKGEIIGFRGVSRDVTERKRAEEALRQSEERYRDILEKMTDSYFEVDLAGNLTFVNSSACHHLGYSREELLGMSYKGFTAEDHIKSLFRIYNEVYRTGVPNKGFHWKIIRKDGSPGFIDASVTPLRNEKGEIIGFSGVGRDITERKKIEDQLILTDRLASIGQLAAGIAHELNNPLTAVIGFSDLLLGRDLTADVKEDLETINQESRRAINIVKGLLAFAREQRIGKVLVDINSVIQGVLQLRSYEQRVSNIGVDARFASALPQVMGNGAQLQQVFLNIIVNAEQAMLEAHSKGKLTITTELVGDIVRVSITDDGPGISPDNMKQLFTPFFTTREVGKGTGLGLSICHGIVTEHGGKIYAESEPGEGATFVVELPIGK
jgi:PAS domain S-box-containing protein